MIAARDWLVLDYVREVYVENKLLGCSERSAPEYLGAARALDKSLGRPVRMAELSEPLITEFKRKRLADGRPSTTVNKDLRHLRPVWRLGHKQGVCPEPPEFDFLGEPEVLPEAWTLREFAAIVAACDGSPPVLGIPGVRFWRALMRCFYDTGFRVSAMLNLRTRDFDLERGTVMAPWSVQKDNADHIIELSRESLEELVLFDQWRPKARGLERLGLADVMFYWPKDRTVHAWPALTKGYREILARAKLPSTGKDLFHKVRRLTATQVFIAHGLAAAQAHMGHSHPSVTKRYIDWKQARLITSARSLPQPHIQGPQQRLFEA